MARPGYDSEEETLTRTRDEAEEPPMFRVLMHNDDYTTMEFVVSVLMAVFYKTLQQATVIMLKIHHEGVGVCGVYTHDVAETKVAMVHAAARENGFPLKCTLEEDLP